MLGFSLVKSKELEEYRKDQEYVEQWQGLWANRPALDKLVTRDASGSVIQIYPFNPAVLYGMAMHIDALRIVLERLREEIFRNGLDIVERYAYKCLNLECGKEFESLPENELTGEPECDTCGRNQLARPIPKNRLKLLELLTKPVNQNYQTLKDVLFQLEFDLDVFDNAYMLLLKDYQINPLTGEIKDRQIKEILRGDPLQIFFVADSEGTIGHEDVIEMGHAISKPVLVCPRPEHRKTKLTSERCTQCGAMGVMAVAQLKAAYAMSRTSPVSEIYYIDGEVIHKSKYQPSLLYGYSPVYSLWMKLMSLFYQDRYIMKYYDKQRSPRALFAVATKSLASFTKAWTQLKQWAKEDPEEVHPLAVETDRAGRQIVQFIDLMHNLTEMQYIEQRNEFRRTIGAEYGVLPLFSGDLPTGWNNEGMQVTVTNRAVKSGQQKLVEGFLDKLLQRLGVRDWQIVFKPSEEADELRQLQIDGQELSNAEALQRMGFEIWFDHTGVLKHSNVPIQMSPYGDMGNPQLSDKRPNAPIEDMGNFEGEPQNKRPSDVGGMMEGHPASGDNTSISNKNKVRLLRKAAPAGQGILDLIQKELDGDGDFEPELVSKSIASMKLEANTQAWQYTFEDLGHPMQKDIRRAVQLMFTYNVSRKTAVDNLVRIGLPTKQAELIVKTEFNHMLNRARELAYKETDPDGTKYKYYWDSSKDEHVCPACDEVRTLTSKGATLEELKDVIQAIAKKHGIKATRRMWHLHPADRCFVKRMKQ